MTRKKKPTNYHGRKSSHPTPNETIHTIKVLEVSIVDLWEAVEYFVMLTPRALKNEIEHIMQRDWTIKIGVSFICLKASIESSSFPS